MQLQAKDEQLLALKAEVGEIEELRGQYNVAVKERQELKARVEELLQEQYELKRQLRRARGEESDSSSDGISDPDSDAMDDIAAR